MAEAWERIYAKFFWAIVILVAAAVVWFMVSEFIRSGTRSDLSRLLKFVAFFGALFVSFRILPKAWRSRLAEWRARRRINEFGFMMVYLGFFYTASHLLLGWPSTWKETIGLGTMGAVLLFIVTVFSVENPSPAESSKGEALPPK